MKLQEIKNEVAKEMGFPNWEDHFINRVSYDKVCERYAQSELSKYKDDLAKKSETDQFLEVNQKLMFTIEERYKSQLSEANKEIERLKDWQEKAKRFIDKIGEEGATSALRVIGQQQEIERLKEGAMSLILEIKGAPINSIIPVCVLDEARKLDSLITPK